MKSLSFKQIITTILISYLISAFINAELNPFNLTTEARVGQIVLIFFSLMIQLVIKNNTSIL